MTNHAGSTMIDSSASGEPSELIDSDELKMRRFLRWVEDEGATFPSMTIKVGQGTRKVHATRPLAKGELVLHVPRKLMLTPEIARASETGKLIAQQGNDFGDYDYLAAYLLQMKREGSFWKPYTDVLPQDYSGCTLLFSESEMEYLKGSYIHRLTNTRRNWNNYIYSRLPSSLKDNGVTLSEFTWAKCAVITRVYGVRFGRHETVALVPLADMFDHSHSDNVRWISYAETGFVVTTDGPIEAGAPMFERYGKRCNAVLLSTYGFCLEENPDNVAEIVLPALPTSHPFLEQSKKLGTLEGEMRAFRVQRSHDESTRALLSYLRLASCEDPRGSQVEVSSAGKVAPFSRKNEIVAMAMLLSACERRMQQFDTSIEQDQALLRDPALSRNVRHAIMVRRDEKVILKHYLDLADMALPLLRDDSCDLNQYAAAPATYCGYFSELVQCLGSRQGT
jgi:histone-lysine N-methyltransferase SETD3